jgi:fructuronate reductase
MALNALGRAALAGLPAECRPLLHPGDAGAGIVHFGMGAFHRAHQAVYTEEAVAAAGGDWGIVGVAPHTPDVVDRLAQQDLLFSVTSASGDGRRTRVVGALAGVRLAAADPDAVVALLADPAVRVVTLTITEKGYFGAVPKLLARGLAARQAADSGPIALVSCDNLPANGRHLRAVVERDFTSDWTRANVAYPSTMVDRIVPAPTASTLDLAAAALGVRDGAAVCAEPYRQWVVEDDFPGGRPAWERAGAVLAADVEPYERLKLRALNGVHSALAYLGALAGRETIAEALQIPGLRDVLRRMVAEDIAPSLEPPAGVSVVAYGDSVLDRFANPVIAHRTVQVAMDGSQKLPQRVLHTMLDRRAAGGAPRWTALVVAAWMRFVQGVADDGRPLPLDDPLAAEIRAVARPEGLLGLSTVFPPEFTADGELRSLVLDWYTALDRHGVEATLAGARP